MLEPGLDRHDWESQWASLEDDLRDDPRSALPELDRLVTQMLNEAGFDPDGPPADDGSEILAELRAARELRGWTQNEFAHRLATYLGQRMTQAGV